MEVWVGLKGWSYEWPIADLVKCVEEAVGLPCMEGFNKVVRVCNCHRHLLQLLVWS